jgi:hypothetical protein
MVKGKVEIVLIAKQIIGGDHFYLGLCVIVDIALVPLCHT